MIHMPSAQHACAGGGFLLNGADNDNDDDGLLHGVRGRGISGCHIINATNLPATPTAPVVSNALQRLEFVQGQGSAVKVQMTMV
jgi:hypothetical protein